MTETYPDSSHGNAPRDSGRGGLILTLGILSLILCAPLGPFAWIMGKGDLQKMTTGRMDDRDRSLTKAGMICGIIGTILLVLSIIGFFFAMVLGAAGMAI